MAVTFARSGLALQNAAPCSCRLGKVQRALGLSSLTTPLSQASTPLRKLSRPNRALHVRAADTSESKPNGGQGSGSTPLRAAPPRPGAAPPKLGAAPPKPGASPPKIGPKQEQGPAPRPIAPPKPSADLPKPMQGPQPSSGVVTSVKSPFGESSVGIGGEKKRSLEEFDGKPKSPFGESSARKPFAETGTAKPAGKRVKIGTGSGTLSPYGKSTTSARYKPQKDAYPGRMPPDFGDSGVARTTTKPATFRPDSSLFTEKSRIELKRDAQAAEKKWEITRGQVVLAFTFVFSIGLMIGTFYLVYKLGGIHFNE